MLRGSLENATTSAVFVTGFQVKISQNAQAQVYNAAFLRDQLSQMAPGQAWQGPLLEVTPGHSGPLQVAGFIVIKGGTSPQDSKTLASVPFNLPIVDPRRTSDGSFLPSAHPKCDRDAAACCDPDEPFCLERRNRCSYVARGFGHQLVCANRRPGKMYDRIFDLQASSDGAHVAYVAGFHCLTEGTDEFCARTLVIDGVEENVTGVPTRLHLSADGKHYSYLGRGRCFLNAGTETCSGWTKPIVDGHPAKAADAAMIDSK